MRKDLNKLLCERERSRSWDKFHYIRNRANVKAELIDDEEGEMDYNGPKQIGMKSRIYGWNTKSFNENLNPLKGQLQAWVGRKWDDFYSELRKNFNMDSTINAHILQHLYQYIEVHTWIGANGKVMATKSWGWDRNEYCVEDGGYSDFYVHPETNIIHKVNREARRLEKLAADDARKARIFANHRKLDEGWEAFRVDGIWYKFKFVAVQTMKVKVRRMNYVTKEFEEIWEEKRTPERCIFTDFIGSANYKLERAGKPTIDTWKDYGFYSSGSINYFSRKRNKDLAKQGKAAVEMKQLNKRELRKYGIK